MLAFTNGRIITPIEDIPQGTILVQDGKILAVGPSEEVIIPQEAKVYESRGKIICPGFIDLHIHGARGRDFIEATPEAINEITDFHLIHGTTSFVPTLISCPHNRFLTIVEQLPKAWAQSSHPSSFLGLHLEGPFINHLYRGVHNLQSLSLPSREKLETFIKHSGQSIKIMTLAPELPYSKEIIQELSKENIVVSLGHSGAAYHQVEEAGLHGLRHTTHIFNAMMGFHHREPGTVGAALDIQEISADVIADGQHVHPMAIRLLWRQKGVEKIMLISDASPVCGLTPGVYKLWESEVRLDEDKVITTDSGRLAGSIMTMDNLIRNFRKMTQCKLSESIRLATYNPAVLLGIEDKKGYLGQGNDADLVIMDENFFINKVVSDGEVLALSQNEE